VDEDGNDRYADIRDLSRLNARDCSPLVLP
jgi:hypothetical protein